MLLYTALNPLKWFTASQTAPSSSSKHVAVKTTNQVSAPVKIDLHKKPTEADTNTLTLNDRLNSLRVGLVSWGGALLNLVPGYKSLVVSRMKHLLFKDSTVEPFKPEKLKIKCLKYEINPGQGKHVLSKKYFIEPDIPSSQQKQLVILVHGARTTGNIYGRLVEKLISQGHPVLVGDLVGFGANSNYALTNQNLVNDVIGMIEEARTLRRNAHISVIGHSLGTAVSTAALKEIFAIEAKSHSGPKTKIDKVVLISAWDNLDNVIKDLLAEDPVVQGQTKLHTIIDKQLGTDQQHVEEMIIQNLKDPRNSIDNDLGIELNTQKNTQELAALNAGRPEEFKIRSFAFVHGKKDNYVHYNRSQELHKKILESGINSHYSLLEHGDHFDRKTDGQDSFPNELLTATLQINPASVNAIDEETAAIIDSLIEEDNGLKLLEKMRSGKVKPTLVQSHLDDLYKKLQIEKYSLVA